MSEPKMSLGLPNRLAFDLGDVVRVNGQRCRVVGIYDQPADEDIPEMGVHIGDPLISVEFRPIPEAMSSADRGAPESADAGEGR